MNTNLVDTLEKEEDIWNVDLQVTPSPSQSVVIEHPGHTLC